MSHHFSNFQLFVAESTFGLNSSDNYYLDPYVLQTVEMQINRSVQPTGHRECNNFAVL